MKFKSLNCLTLISNTLCSQSIYNEEKPLHIGFAAEMATRSHIKYMLDILETLTEKGHRITYLSMENHKKIGESYNVTHSSLGDMDILGPVEDNIRPHNTNIDFGKWVKKILDRYTDVYTYSFDKYQTFFNEDKPDLMICDYAAITCVESSIVNNIPIAIGYQSPMSVVRPPYLTFGGAKKYTSIENYTFYQRFKHGVLEPLGLASALIGWDDELAPMRARYNIPRGDPGPSGFGYLGLGIMNSFIGFETPRHIPSHIHLIGPIINEQYPGLTPELELFLSESSKVLYIAFGSLVSIDNGLALGILEYIQRALNDNLLDGVIWGGLGKTNMEEFPKSFFVDNKEYFTKPLTEGTHDKIKLMKWAPQESILNHPNTKLFLTHGGLDSVYESLISGTPMLVLPFIGDQVHNSILVKENGIGDYILWDEMTSTEVYEKFEKLLDPNNVELPIKVKHMKLITKLNSKRKHAAAELIETYAYSAITCRSISPGKPFEVPCEMKPFLPLDFTMNPIKAYLIDVYTVTLLSILLILSGFVYLSVKFIFIACKKFSKLKTKTD